MSGKQQIKEYDRTALLEKHNKRFLREADLSFAEKHFKIQSNYNRDNFLHSLIMGEILCEDSCEIKKFLDKKLRGALGDENIVVADLRTIQTKYQDINNYYITNNSTQNDCGSGHNWEETTW